MGRGTVNAVFVFFPRRKTEIGGFKSVGEDDIQQRNGSIDQCHLTKIGCLYSGGISEIWGQQVIDQPRGDGTESIPNCLAG